jgi:hypothetical protein
MRGLRVARITVKARCPFAMVHRTPIKCVNYVRAGKEVLREREDTEFVFENGELDDSITVTAKRGNRSLEARLWRA